MPRSIISVRRTLTCPSTKTSITRFRLRPGDETSCLTLYRPTNPRIIAPEPGNKRAVRSYEKAGFRHVKTVFVPDSGEHEYVMEQIRAGFEAPRSD